MLLGTLCLKLKNSLKPIGGIEAGKFGIYTRGIAPIFVDENFSGSLEILLDFTSLYELAKKQGFDIFILINERYDNKLINTAKFTKELIILDSDKINFNALDALKNFGFENDKFAKIDDDYFCKENLLDYSGNLLGYIILHFNDNANQRDISKLNLLIK